jgi:polyhydroxyalkanoate synthase
MPTLGVVGPALGFAEELLRVWSGQSELRPDPKDRRFQDPAWASNPFYRSLLQGYLAWSKWLDTSVGAAGLEHRQTERAQFTVDQLRDAMAPTNFFWGNPAAMKKYIDTGGVSAVRGLANWLDDLAHNAGLPNQVDRRPFKVGENLAATPGAVVHRSEMFELLQYTPQTEQVYERPALSVPPQVNRYYALDLAPGRSMAEYLVRRGVQLFTVVWRNPTAEHRDWGLEAYMGAVREAAEAVRQVTGSEDINALGACAGGITLTMLLAHLGATGERLINAATLLVTQLDTSVESVMTALSDAQTLEMAKMAAQQAGVIEGQQLAQVFAWLRPNDLVWNYWVNNYLLGNDAPAFDVLAWNADATRLTARLQGDLIDLVQSNALVHPGKLELMGTPIDPRRITVDAFVVAAITDHIVPWQGAYSATQLLGGQTEFILSASGHIQSIVAPPGDPRARYFTNGQHPPDPQAWLARAQVHKASWWEAYASWLGERSGELRDAPSALGSAQEPVLGPAPGTYVFG